MNLFKKKTVKGFSWKEENSDVQIHNWAYFCEKFAELPDVFEWRDQLTQKFLNETNQLVLNVAFDFGQSTRMFAEYLDPSSKVTGLNNSSLMTARAIERVSNPKASFMFDSLKKLDFHTETFDEIFVERALFQVSDAQKVVEELVRVLKSGSSIVFCEPNYSAWSCSLGKDVCTAVSQQFIKTMWHANIGQELPALLTSLGLSIESQESLSLHWSSFEELDQYLNLESLINLSGFDRDRIKEIMKDAHHSAEFEAIFPMRVVTAVKS